jgi:hypothetical protein
MKRRIFLASSIGGLTALSGCMGIFSGDEEDDENNDETPESNEDVNIPHDSLGENEISSEFMDQHFQTLGDIQNYTEVYTTETEQGSSKVTKWERDGETGYVTTTVSEETVEEQYYSGDYIGVNNPSKGSVNILEISIPSVSDWGKAGFVRNIVGDGTFSVDSENDTSVVYAGVLNSEGSGQGIEVHISKDRPIITRIEMSESSETYEIEKIDSTQISEPNWFTEARSNNVIVTGGVFEDGEALIVELNEDSQPISENSLLSIINPEGESSSLTFEDGVSAGDTVYIVFRDGTPYYSINQLPSLPEKDNIKDGSYIIRGLNPDGDHQFEVQVIGDSSN